MAAYDYFIHVNLFRIGKTGNLIVKYGLLEFYRHEIYN